MRIYMVILKCLFLLILLPSAGVGSGSDSNMYRNQNEQQQPAESRPDPALKNRQISQSAGKTGSPELDAIDAFQIRLEEAGFAAENAGDASTAVIVNPFTVRKRGWYYGSVYLYHRNDNFDARNFFDPVGVPLPEFKRNQFGLTFGAFVTNKLTISGSYDGTRINRGSTMLSLVPTQEMKKGDFTSLRDIQLIDPVTGQPFTGPDGQHANVIPQERIHPVSLKMLPLIPDPNRSDVTRNYVNNDPSIDDIDVFSGRVDYEFSRKTKLFGNFYLEDRNRINVTALPEFSTNESGKEGEATIQLSHSFSSNKVFDLRLEYTRFSSLTLSKHAGQTGLLESLGIAGVGTLDDMDEGYPEFNISGYAPLGSGFSGFPGFFPGGGISPSTSYYNNYGIEADYKHIRGGHNIAFGGRIHLEQVNDSRSWGTRRGQFNFSGYFTGNAFADFLLGIPDSATRGIGSDRADLRQLNRQLYVRDEWKISSKITLTAGLGYAFSPFPRSIHDNVSFFYPLVFEPPADGEIIVTGSSRARELGLSLSSGEAAYNDRNDWQPNVGVAYSPFGNNRLVLRVSYSIYNNDLNLMMAENYVGKNYPFFYIEKAESPTSPDLDLSNPFASVVASEKTIRALDPHLRNPYIQQWNATAQYHLDQNWDMSLAYRGEKTTRLVRTIPANVPSPAPAGVPIQPRRPNPDFGGFSIVTSGASFSANVLNAQVRRRMTGIFSLQAEFEWRQALSDNTSQPSNPRNLAAERAYNFFGGPLQLDMNYLLDLPLGDNKLLSTSWAGKLGFLLEGWRISGITRIISGQPFHPLILGDFNNDGVWSDRPNRVGSGNLPGSERSIDKWFDTADFATPDLSGTDPQWFGSSGRNILSSPGKQVWDISFLKRTRITADGDLLEFRVQLFNAFNHVNFQRPGNLLGTETFGVISNADDGREIEIAVKYSF